MARWLGWLLVPWLALASGCSHAANPWRDAAPGQKRILASFPPLYCMARAVAGDDAYVLCLLTTTGPHDYQPAPAEMRKLRDADLILANGLQLDDRLMDRLLAGAGVPSSRVVKVGDALPKDQLLEGEMHHGHKHGDFDPHVWLGPPQAILMTRTIADRLAELDPAHKAGYAARADAFIAELQALTAYGKKQLAGKKNRNLLSQHEALAYFAAAFDLHVVGSIQVRPGDDADPVRLGAHARLCREKDVRAIAVEPQYPRQQAEALQQQLAKQGLDVRLVEIDPIETAPLAPGHANPEAGYYLAKMRQNLDNLARALP